MGTSINDVYGKPVTVDQITRSITTIDYEHHEEHSGNAFFAIKSALLNNAGTITMRIQTANTDKYAHMGIYFDAAIAATAEMWVNSTCVDVPANRINPLNRNFNVKTYSGLTICHTPTSLDSRDADLTQYFGATASGGRVSEGGYGSNRGEFILLKNAVYLIKITSRANGNAASILLDWY